MTDDIPIGYLIAALAVMLMFSGFFSMSETCMMALNRYRLRHLVKQGSRGARYAQDLLSRTEELLSFILAGNTVINAATTILTAETCRRLLGEGDYLLAISTGTAAFFILVFAEILPKVFGARFSERLAIIASYVLKPLIRITRPLMWVINVLVKGILKLLRVKPVVEGEAQPLTTEELRTLVLEGGHYIPQKQHSILLNLLDLKNITVDDVMTPRNQIEHVDLEDKIETIRHTMSTATHTRIVLTRGGLEHVVGIVHTRKVMNASRREPITIEALTDIMREPFFVPEGTPVLNALHEFQEKQRVLGLVVDEYGELLGLVTTHDLLEEVVGEMAGQGPIDQPLYKKEKDGSLIVDGACPLRLLNRKLGLEFPLDGPKTLNGLVLEHLEDIPEPGTSLKIADVAMEIMQVQNRMVKVVRILPEVVAATA